MGRLGDWLDERTGWRAVVSSALDEPVRGGARYAYVFGSCLTFVLIVQAATGVVMASCYSPSTTTAWASVAYLQDRMTLGWFVRGLHAAGAGAMVILLVLHMLQVTLWGAYKKPREVNWLVGVLLLTLVMGFALTGYLLPWDQKGYWATQVATSLLGATPVIGRSLLRLVQGGESYGNLTLTRFYALHVFVLPATVFLLVAGHIALFRKHGVTASWRASDAELERRTQPFWPDQIFKDLVAVTVTLGLMVWSVLHSHGASLEAPADPTSSYDARPEWYFLPLFQLLKLFPGKLEIPAALGAPALVLGTLVLLPFLDRGATRDPSRRKRFVFAVAAILGGAVLLGLAARRDDARSESFRAQRQRADQEAERARKLAVLGVPPAGGTAVFENDPQMKARHVFAERCTGCHRFQGAGENKAPDLDGWASRAWLAELIRTPDAPRFYGKTEIHGMKPVVASDEEAAALVEYIFAFGGGTLDSRRDNSADAVKEASVDEARRARGAILWKAKDCDGCHETDGATAGQSPNLAGYGSAAWANQFIADPSAARFFGTKNKMPKFGERLSPAELDAVVGLLCAERAGGLVGGTPSAKTSAGGGGLPSDPPR